MSVREREREQGRRKGEAREVGRVTGEETFVQSEKGAIGGS